MTNVSHYSSPQTSGTTDNSNAAAITANSTTLIVLELTEANQNGIGFYYGAGTSGDGETDSLSMWVNPTSETSLGAANNTFTNITGGADLSFDTVALTSTEGTPGYIGDLVIGNTLADVLPVTLAETPEPSTYALFILGSLALGVWYRRSKMQSIG